MKTSDIVANLEAMCRQEASRIWNVDKDIDKLKARIEELKCSRAIHEKTHEALQAALKEMKKLEEEEMFENLRKEEL